MSEGVKAIVSAVVVSVVSFAIYDFFARPALQSLLERPKA